MNIIRFIAATALLGLFLAGSASYAQSISMSYVTVGNPDNPGDSVNGNLYGSVSYTYDIGEYDVTDSQYCTFLNDVDPTGANTLALYSPLGDAEYGITFNSAAANGSKYSLINGYANMPVVDVDFWDTLRFVNWMNNGEGNASTETGAYTLIGGNTDGYGTPSNAASLLANPQPNAGATVWLPDENEWFKAAYYDPANGTFSNYATQSDTAPGNEIGNGPDEANYSAGTLFSATQSGSYNSMQNYLTAVGSFTNSASYYGTYDQSGEVFEWEGTAENSDPVLRGGDWNEVDAYGESSYERYITGPTPGNDYTGFRVASIPEPGSLILILAGVAMLPLMRVQRIRAGLRNSVAADSER